ncbi:hypothetical protein OHT57_04820 [Streptomyces sp. NBC_00285]|nr:hypothetical protein [Streptomyces sp. NBC_00285]
MPEVYVFMRYGGSKTEAFVDVDRLCPGPGEHTRGENVTEAGR